MLARIRPTQLRLWSFAVAIAHGAGWMLVPIYLGLCRAADLDRGHEAAAPSSTPISEWPFWSPSFTLWREEAAEDLLAQHVRRAAIERSARHREIGLSGHRPRAGSVCRCSADAGCLHPCPASVKVRWLTINRLGRPRIPK